jgi:hypothetical protein
MRHYLSFSPQLLLFSILALLVGGCSTLGDVTPSLQIDKSEHPAYQDEQVRFRTTYYFRIVDSCKLEEGKNTDYYDEGRKPFKVRQSGKPKIVNDTLYRFRMTGKASALFARIHFESGVLRAQQIDPFGSKVVFDNDTNTYRVISANVDRENARRQEIIEEIDRLKLLLTDFKDQEKIKPLIEVMIQNQIKLLGNENDSGLGHQNNTTASTSSDPEKLLCPDGRPIQRSYSLYGPEGVRHLDPHERLLMAMTSDSKPLIGMLQELAGRSIGAQKTHENDWKDIIDERARVFNAQQDIEAFVTSASPTESDITDLIRKLETRFGSK